MKLSISTLAFYPAKIENVLEFITKEKFKYLEIVDEYPYDNLVENDFSSYDINLSVHAPISDVNIASHIDKIRDTLYKLEEYCLAFLERYPAYNLKRLEKNIDYLRKKHRMSRNDLELILGVAPSYLSRAFNPTEWRLLYCFQKIRNITCFSYFNFIFFLLCSSPIIFHNTFKTL